MANEDDIQGYFESPGYLNIGICCMPVKVSLKQITNKYRKLFLDKKIVGIGNNPPTRIPVCLPLLRKYLSSMR